MVAARGMIHTYSYNQERPFNYATMAFSSDVDLKIDSSLEESLPVTVLIFRCVASSPMSRAFYFSHPWFSTKFFAALKYPSLQTIDMNERKTVAMTVNHLRYQEIATCFQSVCVKSRRFTEDSSMQSIMIPTEGQRPLSSRI